jgi:hypothetical protein
MLPDYTLIVTRRSLKNPDVDRATQAWQYGKGYVVDVLPGHKQPTGKMRGNDAFRYLHVTMTPEELEVLTTSGDPDTNPVDNVLGGPNPDYKMRLNALDIDAMELRMQAGDRTASDRAVSMSVIAEDVKAVR